MMMTALGILVLYTQEWRGLVYNNLGAIELMKGIPDISRLEPELVGDRLLYLRRAENYFQEAYIQWNYAASRKNLAKIYRLRGDTFSAIENWDQAITNYQKALEIDTTSVVLYKKLGEIYTYRKPHEPQYLDQAIHYLETAVTSSPRSSYIRLVLGHALFFRKRMPEAIDQLEISVALEPNGYNWTVLGRIYLAERRWTSAINCFQKALALEPKRIDTWLALGEAYAGENDIDQALLAWQAVINLAPDSNLAQEARLKIAGLTGD